MNLNSAAETSALESAISTSSPGLDTVTAPAHLDVPRWASYIALGDSVTEGLTDPYPRQFNGPVMAGIVDSDDAEAVKPVYGNFANANFPDSNTTSPNTTDPALDDVVYRGWADRLAEIMSARRVAAGLPPLEYANLAIRGRLLGPIIEQQLSVALEQKPEIISLLGGGNDVMRPKADMEALTTRLEKAVIEIRAAGIDVLLGTGFKAGGKLKWTRGRTAQLNAEVWSIARRHGAYVMDNWGVKSLYDYQMFAEDLIHPNSIGHSRMANAALVGLGLAPTEPVWDVMLPPLAPPPIDVDSWVPAALQPRWKSIKDDARWAKDFAGPWVERRVTGKSSGDGRSAKYPTLRPWPPTDSGA